MPDLLAHVLAAYVLGAVVVALTDLPDRHLPVAMVGAAMPDAMKATVLLDITAGTVAGVPYSFWGIHTIGGIAVLAGVGTLTVRSSDRRIALALLLGGGASHLLLDLFVIRADGLAPPYLFPFSGWPPPTATVYASTDLWPTALAAIAALSVLSLRVVLVGRR
jgi:membrane-bound metal-dependent hydrolase YbcI (DUF457 family)